jgi:putative aldouronate transport system permease protein
MATEKYRFNTPAGRAFDAVNVVFLVIVGAVALAPFLFVLVRSLASEAELTADPFFWWPQHIDFGAYIAIFRSPSFTRAIITTICVTAVGMVIQLVLTVSMAYPLAKRDLPGRNLVLSAVVVTLVFSGGMIPTFLVVKNLGLLDTYWSLILPLAINPFSLIIVKNFFQNLPIELEESAKVDGATELRVLWHIVLPLSKPILATFALFYAVTIWNDFMSPLLYLNNTNMWTLQMFLRQVTAATDLATAQQTDPNYIPPAQGIKYAVIVVATIPVLIFYPFLQKHFAKGMLIGAVKG